ncbi:MAG: penicillin-binding protein 1C [Acidobacteriota bacterium]|nr:penicillin-binding protein 1C [Acidobacteriota bacterium]
MASSGIAARATAARTSLRRLLVSRRAWVLLALLPLAGMLAAGMGFLVLDWLFPFPLERLERLERPAATVVEDRRGEPLRMFLAADQRWRLPVTYDQMPEELRRAIVASEDQRFFRHPGVDPLAVLRATVHNLRARRVVSGASTLTMQIARMTDPAPRTLVAKAREAFRALQLERQFSKRELLEIYLNLAPYGGNLEGVGAAARFYFGKPVEQLALGEIGLLVALPRSPTLYDPVQHPEAALAVRDKVLRQLRDRGAFTDQQVREAMRVPVPRRRLPAPFEAPHFARRVVEEAGASRSGQGGAPRIRTSLELELQQVAEENVEAYVRRLRSQGIGNAAAVVVENSSHRVRGWVGSGGFEESEYSGQVDGVVARRSPGSTLKPFLYGLAFDDGRVVPASYLLDVPTDFAGYVAENYDGLYRGRVEAQQALVHSLNAPAVRLLARVGLGEFFDLLQRGGARSLDRPAYRYGLPLILGSGELTLLELAQLYSSLANGGEALPVTWAPDEGGASGIPERLLSEEAAWLLTETLLQVERPDLPRAWSLSRSASAVAWKTGTSYGHRDAWAVGYSRRFTIAVWVGNFDGSPRHGISGSEHAAPLLFDLFRALDPGGPGPAEPALLRLGELEVCALSHLRPGPHCPRTVQVTALPGKTRLPLCDHHRRALADADTGELLDGTCLADRQRTWLEYTAYPAELVAWWRSRGQEVAQTPTFAEGCAGAAGDRGPRILSPDPATPYRLRPEAPLRDQRLPLVARAQAEVRRLYWYQDGLLIGSTTPEDRLMLDPHPGHHRLVVTDDRGRSSGVTYRVE